MGRFLVRVATRRSECTIGIRVKIYRGTELEVDKRILVFWQLVATPISDRLCSSISFVQMKETE